MTRVRNWDVALATYIEERRHTPFAWHENDCASFVAGGILVVTGEDLFSPYRGRYSDERGAAALIARAGGLRQLCPLPSKPLGFAQRGDGVMALLEGRETMGLVTDGSHWCAPGPDGLLFYPLDPELIIDVMAT